MRAWICSAVSVFSQSGAENAGIVAMFSPPYFEKFRLTVWISS